MGFTNMLQIIYLFFLVRFPIFLIFALYRTSIHFNSIFL